MTMDICRLNSDQKTNKKISVILLDWSVRESAHIIDYLNNQTLPRPNYEIIWIEYYSRRFEEIEKRTNCEKSLRNTPVLDQWLILDMPEDMYYHKHFMYNIGLLYSSGEIIVICDSDGIVKPTFLQSIVDAFSQDSNIVLHLDQLRNHNKKFYPFNFPSIEDIHEGASQLVDGKPWGLLDTHDIIHSRNYGSCFCAKRSDLIAIGGADEHIDYLGHICGPYEMTWRLVNAGKREVWHDNEWMYHVWHPGQAGDQNYVGPHDGFMMSTTALNIKSSKRILPLKQNNIILRKLKEENLGQLKEPVENVMDQLLREKEYNEWILNFDEMRKDKLQCSSDYDIQIYSTNNPGTTLKRLFRNGIKWILFFISKSYTAINRFLGRKGCFCLTDDIKRFFEKLGCKGNSSIANKISWLYKSFLQWIYRSI
jgi:hypothetical protein